jgi:cytochrome c553
VNDRRQWGCRAFGAVLALIAASWTAEALADMPKGDPARGRELARACDGCHGAGGVAPDDQLANLAGQHVDYLEKQLLDMRSLANKRAGTILLSDLDQQRRAAQFNFTRIRRNNEIMDPLVVDLRDQDIADLAAHYHRLPCGAATEGAPPAPAAAVRCGSCHGPAGVSTNSMIPNIAGQPAAYLTKRLGELREYGLKLDKKARRRDIMASQARLLSEADIKVVAEYYARLACR